MNRTREVRQLRQAPPGSPIKIVAQEETPESEQSVHVR